MKNSPILNWLVPLIVILALFSAGAGLFWRNGGSPFTFTSLLGQTIQMERQGLYRNDTLFTDGSFRGTEAVTLFASVPLLGEPGNVG
jgi:hypothetical protein